MEEVDFFQDLSKQDKEAYLFTSRWENNLRLSNASTFETKPPEITNMIKYVRHHANEHSIIIYCGLVVVVGLDRQQLLYIVNNSLIKFCSMSLLHVLYHHMKLAEGYSLL